MTKPDFKEMTRKELKSYIRQHPTDDEAIRELFISRRHPDAKVYPNSMSPDEIEQVILDHIQNKQNKVN